MPWVFRHYQCRDGHLITEHPTSSAVHWQPHSHWREGGRSCSAARVRWHQGEPRGWPEGAVPLPRVRHPGQIGVDLASGHCLTILWILCFLLVCNTPTNPKLKTTIKAHAIFLFALRMDRHWINFGLLVKTSSTGVLSLITFIILLEKILDSFAEKVVAVNKLMI